MNKADMLTLQPVANIFDVNGFVTATMLPGKTTLKKPSSKHQQTQLITCCFSSTTAARGAHEVADLRAPWQKAPEADRGASKGVQATLPGYREATMLA